MTTRELIALLNELDPSGDLEVLESRYSDYGMMKPDSWEAVRAVKKPASGYVMREHWSMCDEDQANARRFVFFRGN